MWRNVTSFAALLILAAASSFNALHAAESSEVTSRIIASKQSVSPGQTVKIGVEFKIPAGVHIYFREPGDSGRPTTVNWTVTGSTPSPLQWPMPERFEDDGLVAYGYKDRVVLVSELQLPSSSSASEIEIKADISWLACGNGSCIPGKSTASIKLPLLQNASQNPSEHADLLDINPFAGSIEDIGKDKPATGSDTTASTPGPAVPSISLPYALLLGFLAGMLLNLMPCVLPVIALKIMSFTKQAGQDRRESAKLGLAYTLGTLATFAAMAAAMVIARAMGTSLGWGFQFQSMSYLVGMASIICLMTLSLFGLFYVNVQTGVQSLENVASKNGMMAAFARGISATLLSTPCSAPMLGTALGFALSQPAIWIFAVLLSVGSGLAAPYLVLSCFPAWLKFLPKPGEWMERFKEAMGFLMLGTLVWMLSVIARVGGSAALVGSLIFLFCLTVGAWFFVRFAPQGASFKRRALVALLSAGLVGWSFYTNVWSLSPEKAEAHVGLQLGGVTVMPYSKATLEQELAQGKIVFLDATAEWCLTCKLNERVLSSSSVQEALRKNNVVVLQADWTRGDAEVGALLKTFGRPGVPMYVIYSPGKEPVLLPELITPGIVTDAIQEAAR